MSLPNNTYTADPDYDRKGYVKRRLDNLTDPTLLDRMTRKDRADFNLAHNPKYYSELAKKRRKPYYHFQFLKRNKPDSHKDISRRGGLN